ncbi:hypothetical protein PRUPE_7G216100 [Prunus persica]|uniref:Uncharacterized protein n=1 Tax=Prunus persica TaxID=3760 RepID=A0A251NHS7_PRUPE|nr:hypothetical protein PRUPE_7G216100 [Prunus persica]
MYMSRSKLMFRDTKHARGKHANKNMTGFYVMRHIAYDSRGRQRHFCSWRLELNIITLLLYFYFYFYFVLG